MNNNIAINRARTINGWRRQSLRGGKGQLPSQIVVKVPKGAGRRSIAQIKHLIAYITRTLPEQQRQGKNTFSLYDEDGVEQDRGFVWDDLASDRNNLSKKARLALQDNENEVGLWNERLRLRNVQAWHVIVAVKDDSLSREERREALKETVRGAIFEHFTQSERKVLWVVHDDGPEIHAHLVVKSRGIDTTGARGRYRLDKDELADLRELFVRHARSVGLDVTTERREDREEIRQKILTGQERLRQSKKMSEIKMGAKPAEAERRPAQPAEAERSPTQSNLQVQRKPNIKDVMPNWYGIYGKNITRAATQPRAKRAQDTKIYPQINADRLKDIFTQIYANSDLAWESFVAMSQERPERPERPVQPAEAERSPAQPKETATWDAHPGASLASWYLRHRPEYFGEIINRDVWKQRIGYNQGAKRLIKTELQALPFVRTVRPVIPVTTAPVFIRGSNNDLADKMGDRAKMIFSFAGLKTILEKMQTVRPVWLEKLDQVIDEVKSAPVPVVSHQVQAGSSPAKPAEAQRSPTKSKTIDR